MLSIQTILAIALFRITHQVGLQEVIWPLPTNEKELHVANLWRPFFTVDESCPRFVYIDFSKQGGLGDQLERFFTAFSLVFLYRDQRITMLTDYGTIGRDSVLFPESNYDDVVHNILGFPRIALNLSFVRKKIRPREIALESLGYYGDFLIGKQNLSTSMQCNHMVVVDVYDSCRAWCPFVFAEEVESALRPILRETRNYSNSCHEFDAPLKRELVNIVWHVRTGDICLHCEDIGGLYYQGIYNFISMVLPHGTPHQNIIVHQPDSKHHLAPELFERIPNSTHFTSNNVSHAACNFLNADILVLTGSSFPSMVSWFSPHYKPLILQEKRDLKDFNRHSRYPYIISPGEAIRLDNGIVVNRTRSIGEIAHEARNMLTNNLVFARVGFFVDF